MNKFSKYIPGIILVIAISLLSIFFNDLIKSFINLESLTIAIIIGIVVGNVFHIKDSFKPGINLSLKKLLKVGIVLLGFKLNVHSILKLGPQILIMVPIYVLIALTLSIVLGKLFKVNNKLSVLIGVGSCICGASAVMAMAPCINAKDDDSIIAVSIVSFLGAVGVLIYTAIATSSIGLTPIQYGVWSGLSLHGVAHAIAAAFAMGKVSGEIGTFVKMARVLMLVPVSLVLGLAFNKVEGEKGSKKAKFPLYVLFFIIAGVINSFGIIPYQIINILGRSSSFLILMAMTAMGLSVNLKSILNKGKNASILGTVLFIILSLVSIITISNIL